jgi:hypothetical protein
LFAAKSYFEKNRHSWLKTARSGSGEKNYKKLEIKHELF